MGHIGTYESPLGKITLYSDGRFLTGLWFENQKNFGSTMDKSSTDFPCLAIYNAKNWLDMWFKKESPLLFKEIRLIGNETMLAVWNSIASVPFGKNATYKDIIDDVRSFFEIDVSEKDVEDAIMNNPLSLIIPTHRITDDDGNRISPFDDGLLEKIISFEQNV